MPRMPRVLHPGAWYHVTARGIERRPIFRDARDRAHFLELLEEGTARFAVRLRAFVLMDNHYHLLLDLTRPNLSRALQWLNLSYSVWFNRRHTRSGYLFQGRFKAILVEPAAWGLSLSAYLHLNPVRVAALGLGKTDRRRAAAGTGSLPPAELVRRRLDLLRAYPWSSYRAYIGLAPCPTWLEANAILDQGGGATPARRPEKYRQYVENQVREGSAQKPWAQIRDQILLGSARFVEQVKRRAGQNPKPSKAGRWARQTVPWEDVVRAVEKARGERWDDFHDRHGHRGRDQALHLARRATDLTVSQLARQTGLKQGVNVSMSVKRYQRLIDENPAEKKLATNAAEMLFVTL